jgi:hypothetical protein
MSFDIRRLFTFRIRKRRRRRASNGLFVVLESIPGKHQIDDISSGGLSYYYIDNGIRPKIGSYALKVIANSKPISLRLVGKTICDRVTGELVSQSQKIKRRSIRFERMNSQQKKMLRDIIKNHTVSPSFF